MINPIVWKCLFLSCQSSMTYWRHKELFFSQLMYAQYTWSEFKFVFSLRIVMCTFAYSVPCFHTRRLCVCVCVCVCVYVCVVSYVHCYNCMFLLQKQVDANQCVTQAKVKEALDILRGAVMIVYPMGLPPHDPVHMELENQEDLSGTQVCVWSSRLYHEHCSFQK